MIVFTIINKKEQARKLRQKYFFSYDSFYKNKQTKKAINLCQKDFHSYDTFHNNKQERRNNKFAPEIFSFV